MAEMPHMRRREGDEYYCPRCQKRWGVDEEDPSPCVEDKREVRPSPVLQRSAQGNRLLEPAKTEMRRRIERIWRDINQHPDHVCLAASEQEWAFFERLFMGEQP